jgi:hypothetical protein
MTEYPVLYAIMTKLLFFVVGAGMAAIVVTILGLALQSLVSEDK